MKIAPKPISPRSSTPNTENERQPLSGRRAPPTRPGLALGLYNLRDLGRILVRPGSPAEVAQRSAVLHGAGVVAAALAGCFLVCVAVAFPPAAVACAVFGGLAFAATLALIKRGATQQAKLAAEARRAQAQRPPALSDETLANIAQVEEVLTEEAIQLAGAVEEADQAEAAVRAASRASGGASDAPPTLQRQGSGVSFKSSLSRQSSNASTASYHSSGNASDASEVSHVSDYASDSDDDIPTERFAAGAA